MNYYPFHLGDYAAHTAHLTWEEDLVYRRMLDLYYLHERPIPQDTKKLARVIRMPKALSAIQSVLEEFFELREDGWHNKRADQELSAMGEKQELSEERSTHEKDRQKRYRERRAAMFEALRAVGIVPAWDVSMKDLQRLHDAQFSVSETPETVTENAPETNLKRNGDVFGDAPATAIPTPTPTPTPTPLLKKEEERAQRKRSAALTCPGDVDQQTWDDWQALRKAKRAPVTETVLAGARREAEKAGMPLEAFLQVWCRRGSQGLEAAWLKPEERQHGTPAALNRQEALEARNRAVVDAMLKGAI